MKKQASKEFYLDTGDGHKIYGAVYGDARSAPLLLIHGGAGHVLDMDRLELPSNRRVVVMHQRGMGNSLPAGEMRNNTIDANIDDIERVRRHLNIRRMDILGWSFGTIYMAGYAFRHPQRCKSLTGYAPYFGTDEGYQVIEQKDKAAADAYYDFHGSRTGMGITSSAFRKASHPDYNQRFNAYHAVFNLAAQSPVPAQDMLRARSLQDWKNLFAVRAAHAALDLELFTGKDRFLEKAAIPLDCPVTLVYGDQDVWSVPNAYDLSLFHRCRTIILPGMGHDIHEASRQLFPCKTRRTAPDFKPK